MSKDKKPRQRQAAQRAAAKQLAQDELRREQHAALIVERQGDPRYTQRTNHGDGSATITMTEETTEAMREQRALFVEKFGREPGPEDPLFFDPDADTPQPLRLQAVQDALVEATVAAGLDPAYALAANEVGYMPIETTLHLFSQAELDRYTDAVRRHQLEA